MANFNLFDSLGEAFGNFFLRNRTWNNRSSFMIGQKGPVWLDVNRPYEMYNTIPQLKAVIDRKASMFSNMELKLRDKKTGKEIENEELFKLIQNPNPSQSMNDWLVQFKLQEQVYGNQFMYKNKPSRVNTFPTTLWNISSRYIRPILSGKLFDQTKIEEIITGFEYNEMRKISVFKGSEILYSRLNDLDNPILGLSPILSLKYPISNIDAAYQFRNTLLVNKGPLGIITNESKDSMGNIPLKPEERKNIEEQFNKDYGVLEGKRAIKISEASMKWQAMTFPTKDMLLFEEVDANQLTIIDHFGLNANIFSSKNATYENVRQGILISIQDTIQPEADKFAQALGKFIGIPEGSELFASYEHLPILKEAKNQNMLSITNIVDALNQAVEGKLITPQQAQIVLQNELSLLA